MPKLTMSQPKQICKGPIKTDASNIGTFSEIVLDIVGTLPDSTTGHQFILVLIDYSSRFPKTIPLWSVMGQKVAKELMKWISRVSIPKEINTDQGTSFMSHVICSLCSLLKLVT